MLKIKHTYEYDLSNINHDQMVVKLGMSVQEAEIILTYRERFALLEGGEGALVNLTELWEALDKPYGQYDVWLIQVVQPFVKRLNLEISKFNHKPKGRGRPRVDHFVCTEAAKHLALAVNNAAGDEVRSYFITVERLFNSMVKHNALRVELHDVQKQFYAQDLPRRKFDKKATGKDLVMFNTLVKKASGGLNELKTNLDYYAACQSVIGNALLNGKDPEQLKRALC